MIAMGPVRSVVSNMLSFDILPFSKLSLVSGLSGGVWLAGAAFTFHAAMKMLRTNLAVQFNDMSSLPEPKVVSLQRTCIAERNLVLRGTAIMSAALLIKLIRRWHADGDATDFDISDHLERLAWGVIAAVLSNYAGGLFADMAQQSLAMTDRTDRSVHNAVRFAELSAIGLQILFAVRTVFACGAALFTFSVLYA
jgi:hypothetical protein